MFKLMVMRPLLMSALIVAIGAAALAQGRPKKKLVQYGFDVQFPAYVAEHIREMERRPFDGIMMRTDRDGFSHVFYNRELNEAETKAYFEALSRIRWEKFTDNFFFIYCRSNMDWFSEEDWAPDGWVLRNVRLCARAAKVGRCVGVAFDPESFWGRRPWHYAIQPHANEKSFAEFEKIVRKRGAQFMEALQEEYPDLVLLTLYMLERSGFAEARKESDPVKRRAIMQKTFEDECLWPAFVNGMMDGVKGKTVMVAGNEDAYYYDSPEKYTRSVQIMKEGVKNYFDSASWPKYQRHVQAGQAVWIGFWCNLLPMRLPCSNMTPEERAKVIEHNIYYALKTSDRYVWMWSELMNWWTGRRVPPYLEDAIRSAKRKVADGEPLGYDVEQIIERSGKQLWKDRAEFKPKTATIRRPAGAAPVIDGKLGDAAWKSATPLGPFVAYVESPVYDLSAETKARVLYDGENLYVAFDCKEPDMKTTRESFARREDFDDMSVILAPEGDRKAWRSFCVASNGKRKDAHPGGEKANWKPDYKSAVLLGADGWSVEMAIPWKALGWAAPKPGEKVAANVAHMRFRWGELEYSTWSKFRGVRGRPSHRRVEPELLGTWVFE